MDTTPYLLNEFKAFTLETLVLEIKDFFTQTSFSHFPIVSNEKFIGLISETDIEGIDEENKEIGYFQYLFLSFFADYENSLLEILNVFATNETNIVPVIDIHKKYIGYYELADVLNLYSDTPFLNNQGAVIELEKDTSNFSFSEVCQIVESNKGKVLGLFISENKATTVKITLKFESQDINEILQSFRRYEYTVISNHEEDFYLEDLKDRSKYLQKYLNI